MKKYLVVYVLLLALVLSSCTSVFPKTRQTEETGDTEILPEQTNIPGLADDEDLSIGVIGDSSSYQGVPREYSSILDDLYIFSELVDREEYLDSPLEEIGFVEHPRDGKLAYAVIDINKDGIPELLLGTVDGLKDSAPNSIFTLKDGKPILVVSFWSRSLGVIAADGTIYSVGSGGAAHTYLSSFRLDKNADTLTQLTDIHSDYSLSEEKVFFVEVVDNRDHYITEKSFWDFYEEYYSPSETMELTIIPIAN